MGLILTLIFGGIIGWLAASVMGRHEGIVASVLIGIVGAFIGGILASWLGRSTGTYLSFSWAGLVWSFIGALLFSALLNLLLPRSSRHV